MNPAAHFNVCQAGKGKTSAVRSAVERPEMVVSEEWRKWSGCETGYVGGGGVSWLSLSPGNVAVVTDL